MEKKLFRININHPSSKLTATGGVLISTYIYIGRDFEPYFLERTFSSRSASSSHRRDRKLSVRELPLVEQSRTESISIPVEARGRYKRCLGMFSIPGVCACCVEHERRRRPRMCPWTRGRGAPSGCTASLDPRTFLDRGFLRVKK